MQNRTTIVVPLSVSAFQYIDTAIIWRFRAEWAGNTTGQPSIYSIPLCSSIYPSLYINEAGLYRNVVKAMCWLHVWGQHIRVPNRHHAMPLYTAYVSLIIEAFNFICTFEPMSLCQVENQGDLVSTNLWFVRHSMLFCPAPLPLIVVCLIQVLCGHQTPPSRIVLQSDQGRHLNPIAAIIKAGIFLVTGIASITHSLFLPQVSPILYKYPSSYMGNQFSWK